jgi:predicted membrane metal-binding protein
MSVKFTYLLHWLSARWPYAVAMLFAFFFIVLQGFPVLKGWLDLWWNPKKIGLEINKLQIEPQLVTDADDIARYDPERKRLLAKTAQRIGGEFGHDWLVVAGIVTACVGFIVLLVVLFDR